MEDGLWFTLPIRKVAVKTIFSIFSGGDQEGATSRTTAWTAGSRAWARTIPYGKGYSALPGFRNRPAHSGWLCGRQHLTNDSR